MIVEGKYGEAIIYNDNAEEGVVTQVKELLDTKLAEDAHIRIMPDCHQGAGCVIGTTMKITDKVCPNLTGVDIGCGVLAVNLGGLGFNIPYLDDFIHVKVPHGFAIHDKIKDVDKEYTQHLYDSLACKDVIDNEKFHKSVGTLGGGNHFIEFAEDEQGDNWLLVHSGSRNSGLRVAQHYQQLAVQECSDDVSKDLAYLEANNDSFHNYLSDVKIMSEYANLNRMHIASQIIYFLDAPYIVESFDTVHNYIDDNILRKGAVKANERFVVPLNMADGTLICRGKHNDEWNGSSPHGAGRVYSRSKAKKELSMGEFQSRMENVYSTCVCEETLDESPMAYKDGNEIMELITPTAEIVTKLRPFYNFKAK